MTSLELLQLLLKVSVASTAACALVLLLRGPLRRHLSAGSAYGLWAMVPLAALATLLPAPRTVVVSEALALGQIGRLHAAPVLPLGGLDLVDVLSVLWVIGVIGSAGWLYWQQRRFMRALGPLQAAGDGCWQAADVPGLPALVGVLRPRIVLPASFHQQYSAQEQALIVLHERIHLRRGDAWVNAAVALWRCLFWFNPLWIPAQRWLRADQEFSCDACVIAERGDARRSYASAMLKTSLALSPLPVGCHWQDTHPLKERIVMLKREQHTPAKRRLAVLCATGLVAAASAMAWAAQPAQVVAGKPVRTGSDVTTPDGLAPMPAPAYPAAAIAQGQSGKVVLEIDVGTDGKPTAISVVESSPAGVFDDSTVAAAWNWQFNPSMVDGKPVAGKVRVPVNFELDETTTHSDNSGS